MRQAPAHLPGRARQAAGHWWDARTVRFRKTVRTLVLLLLTSALSLLLGAATARADSPVGPHEAHWSASLDSTLALDLGPLGGVSLDSPIAPLGVTVVLGQIPGEAESSTVSPETLGTALASDSAAYAALITHPELTIERGARALVDDALRRAGVIESVLLSLVAAGRLATGGRLRDAVRTALSRGPASGLLVAATAATCAALLVPALLPAAPTGSSLSVLAGTPLAGARVSGRAADVVEAYGGRLVSFLEDNRAFYAQAEDNLRAAWALSDALQGQVPVLASSGRAAASDGGLGAGLVAAPLLDGATGPAGTAWAIASRTTTTAVLTTDLHCNLDVIAFAGVLDEVSSATVHMDDGDLTMTGSDPEQLCVDALSRAVPGGVGRVATTGNHDSPSTAARLRAQGWTVTDGTVQTVAGLRILGDSDPLRTTATGTVAAGEESIEELAARLADTSCQASRFGTGVDLVLIHQPAAFPVLASQGCAPLLVAGHVHVERGMSVVEGARGPVAELVSGAGKGGTSLGQVTSDAYLHVLSFAQDGTLLGWRAVVLHPDASVSVGAWQAVPAVGTTGQGAAR